MRTWGSSGAGEVLRRAQALSRLARRTGCDLDQARDVLAQPLTRRGFLATAGAGAVAGLGVSPARAASGRDAPRVVIVGAGIAGLGCA
jgi:hypothetical protein